MSKHIGTVGAKITVEVTLVNVYEFTSFSFSYRGESNYIYTMKDADGNVIVWKTTSIMAVPADGDGWQRIDKGDVIRITGKVKEHGEYKGTQQTVLTRCKYELIKTAPVKLTKEEIEAQKRKEQLESLADDDFIWRMPYKQYKEHYADCETVVGSYDYADSSIEVIIRAGRLKNSGVRGRHFFGYQFRTDDGALVCYRAVSEENARKQMRKEHPNSENWECTRIFR